MSRSCSGRGEEKKGKEGWTAAVPEKNKRLNQRKSANARPRFSPTSPEGREGKRKYLSFKMRKILPLSLSRSSSGEGAIGSLRALGVQKKGNMDNNRKECLRRPRLQSGVASLQIICFPSFLPSPSFLLPAFLAVWRLQKTSGFVLPPWFLNGSKRRGEVNDDYCAAGNFHQEERFSLLLLSSRKEKGVY